MLYIVRGEHSAKIMLQLLPIIFFVINSNVKAQHFCSYNTPEVLELPHFQNRNFTNVLVSWEKQEKGCQDLGLKLTLRHEKFKACPRYKRDLDISERNITSGTNSIILENLLHFSIYKLTICSLSKCQSFKEIMFETKESVPRLSALRSSINYDYKDTETSLTFNWRPPPQSQCDLYGSLLKHYHYKLANLDRKGDRNPDIDNVGLIPMNRSQLTIEDLHPNSCYALFIFLTNSNEEYHQDHYLKVEKCTLPSEETLFDNKSTDSKEEETIMFGQSEILVFAVSLSVIIIMIFAVIIARVIYKIRNKIKLRQNMRNYFGSVSQLSSENTGSTRSGSYHLGLGSGSENDYDSPTSRTRSPTDPLPPLLDEGHIEDVPGYSKLKNYTIFKFKPNPGLSLTP